MMNTRCTKLSMVRDDSKSSKTSNKKCPVVLHGDHIGSCCQGSSVERLQLAWHHTIIVLPGSILLIVSKWGIVSKCMGYCKYIGSCCQGTG